LWELKTETTRKDKYKKYGKGRGRKERKWDKKRMTVVPTM
jgi:hypothetical protein